MADSLTYTFGSIVEFLDSYEKALSKGGLAPNPVLPVEHPLRLAIAEVRFATVYF